jgi:hypothetical protein
MNSSANDVALLLLSDVDTDDDEIEKEFLRDRTTKETFVSMIDSATQGEDLLRVIDLLPNSSQRYGHSLTMNAIVKIIARHATFKDRCTTFYTIKKRRV